ncbi:ParD-like family protein [Rheinheimera oceanensis]|jgi:hypothetical protein|uniref:ParD-like family protein n=1 Tax=Rheinheimera oceanensis TaxID=2817449 RepID=UPI001BFCF980|nr:ParD-like family protein [Rheinheimera oceanensis]
MAVTIKVSDEQIVQQVRKESELMSRSIGEQAAHWMRIGRFIEQSPLFDMAKVKAILQGQLSPDQLASNEEAAVYLGMFEADMFNENTGYTHEQQAFYQQRQQRGLGAGVDSNGEVITQAELNATVKDE